MNFIAPQRELAAFTCPHCGAYAQQHWWYNTLNMGDGRYRGESDNPLAVSQCQHCEGKCIWHQKEMILPSRGSAPTPNSDLPEDIKNIYEEAAAISGISPRGAAALLRLAIQKLCKELGGSGNNINDDIKGLVQKGLPVTIQQALDIVRVIGNEAVHPGQIDTDDPDVVSQLFNLVNLISEYMISMPKKVADSFASLPVAAKEAIKKRDAK